MTEARKALQLAAADELLDPKMAELVRVTTAAFAIENKFEIDTTIELRTRMERLLKDDKLSVAIKSLLAYEGRYLNVAKLWSYEHFSGLPLEELVAFFPLNAKTALATARNENHTSHSVDLLLALYAPAHDSDVDAKQVFVENLNETAFRSALSALFAYRRWIKGSNVSVIGRAKKLYNIDEGTPDEWVVRLLS